MLPDSSEKLTQRIQDLFRDQQIKVHHCMQQGLAIKDYQFQDRTHQCLLTAIGILETFNGQYDKYYAVKAVEQCLKLIQERYDGGWKDLPKDECLQRLLAGVGFLAADMDLTDEAEYLFNALALLDPGNVHPLLGIAYTKLVAGSAHQALEVIREKVLNLAPGNDLGLALLALTYDALNKTEEALAAASAVITANRDEAAVVLAREVQSNLGNPVVADYIEG